ncbi:putative antibiotic biosynthesis monooxygenase [Rosellinia necatrix]|uniref:Putative antibiotic biosynthesis monooxygenase n=1 Tax=Rosellinia necatrix TaxID=77044 RepID=A0A1W2TAQ3_ROSNE|nr:putative antibiotic biosynthesis monooxygenase [Rosellinia necatrix]
MVYTIVVHLRAKAGADNVARLHAKLNEAAAVYARDRETVSWLVMQSVHDARDFTIVERYETEASQQYHLGNPYWETFDPFVLPLLDRPMDLRRFEELRPVEGEEALLALPEGGEGPRWVKDVTVTSVKNCQHEFILFGPILHHIDTTPR